MTSPILAKLSRSFLMKESSNAAAAVSELLASPEDELRFTFGTVIITVPSGGPRVSTTD